MTDITEHDPADKRPHKDIAEVECTSQNAGLHSNSQDGRQR
jgi:hypothetical protein